MGFRFEELEIFHDAIEFAAGVYEGVGRFPDTEKYNLSSQIMRAVNSISLNIAEGSGRGTGKEFSRFLDIAVGSYYEVVAGILLARRLGYITDSELEKRKDEAETLCKRINAFKRTLK